MRLSNEIIVAESIALANLILGLFVVIVLELKEGFINR
jgi:hypothetical protein